jgi:hypothetical protein
MPTSCAQQQAGDLRNQWHRRSREEWVVASQRTRRCGQGYPSEAPCARLGASRRL